MQQLTKTPSSFFDYMASFGQIWTKVFLQYFKCFFFFHFFKSGPVAMRRGKPRPFPSSSSSTIQLFPGWWAVVLSSVEVSIRINQKSTISQDTKVAVSSSSSSESSSPSDEKVGHLFHLLKHQTFTTLLVSIRFNDVSMVFSAFSAHQVFSGQKVAVHQFVHNSDASIRLCEMAATLLLEQTFTLSSSSLLSLLLF